MNLFNTKLHTFAENKKRQVIKDEVYKKHFIRIYNHDAHLMFNYTTLYKKNLSNTVVEYIKLFDKNMYFK